MGNASCLQKRCAGQAQMPVRSAPWPATSGWPASRPDRSKPTARRWAACPTSWSGAKSASLNPPSCRCSGGCQRRDARLVVRCAAAEPVRDGPEDPESGALQAFPFRGQDRLAGQVARSHRLAGGARRSAGQSAAHHAFEFNRNLANIGKPIRRSEWGMPSPMTTPASIPTSLDAILGVGCDSHGVDRAVCIRTSGKPATGAP